MEPDIRPAPDGIVAMWPKEPVEDGESLVIWISDKLDRVTRQRYIDQAKREHGEPRRRRAILPLPLVGGTGGLRKAGVFTAATVIATTVTAAVLLPWVRDVPGITTDRPPVAVPAPARPTPPGHASPAWPGKPTPQPSLSASMQPPSPLTQTSSAGPPSVSVPEVTPPAGVPSVVRPAPHLPPVTRPPVHAPAPPPILRLQLHVDVGGLVHASVAAELNQHALVPGQSLEIGIRRSGSHRFGRPG